MTATMAKAGPTRLPGSRVRFERTDAAAGRPAHTRACVDLHDDIGPLLQTSVAGTLQALDGASLRRAFFGMPLMTLGVMARIHWQALRLWRKRLPFISKPAAPEHFISR